MRSEANQPFESPLAFSVLVWKCRTQVGRGERFLFILIHYTHGASFAGIGLKFPSNLTKTKLIKSGCPALYLLISHQDLQRFPKRVLETL